MKKASIESIIQASGLKKTTIRLKIFEFLSKSKTAVSQPELEKEFKNDADRVTLYRVLNAFEEKGLIHKIIDLQGTGRFALCNHNNFKEHVLHDEHIHFNCTECGKITCLDNVHVPEIKLPKNYKATVFNMSVLGICNNCAFK